MPHRGPARSRTFRLKIALRGVLLVASLSQALTAFAQTAPVPPPPDDPDVVGTPKPPVPAPPVPNPPAPVTPTPVKPTPVNPTPVVTPPPVTPPTPVDPAAPVTLPKVHFVASDQPSLPGFDTKEGDIDVFAMQAALKNPTHPDDTPLEKDIRSTTIDFLTTRRAADEPQWSDSLNPMVWVTRTQKGTNLWWRALKAIPAKDRPVFEGIPFIWQDGLATAGTGIPKLTDSQRLNNFGLTALLENANTTAAADMMERAVTANKSNYLASYNAGILEMAQHNRQGAVAMFLRATDHAEDPQVKDRANAYIKQTIALNNLLKKDDGSARRLYDEFVDCAWAIANAEQYDLAEYVAGQAMVLDPDIKRPEAPLVFALCYSKQKKLDKSHHSITDAVGAYTKYDDARTELLKLLHE